MLTSAVSKRLFFGDMLHPKGTSEYGSGEWVHPNYNLCNILPLLSQKGFHKKTAVTTRDSYISQQISFLQRAKHKACVWVQKVPNFSKPVAILITQDFIMNGHKQKASKKFIWHTHIKRSAPGKIRNAKSFLIMRHLFSPHLSSLPIPIIMDMNRYLRSTFQVQNFYRKVYQSWTSERCLKYN